MDTAGVNAEEVLERHRPAISTHTRRGRILSVYNFDVNEPQPDLQAVIF